jgi:hypothetical protein
MFSLLAEDEMSQTEEAIFVYKMAVPPFHSLDVAFLDRLATSLPLRFKRRYCEPIWSAFRSGPLSDQTSEHGSSRSTEDTIAVHPVTAYEQASRVNAALVHESLHCGEVG